MSPKVRQARELLFQVLEDIGIPFLFGLEGTTEIPLIDGCAEHPQVKYVQVLHENIAVGAAMGYGRMTGKPGVCVLHVTPGIGHAIDNLFNAWKAKIPLVVIAGQQDTEVSIQEPILWSDTVQLTRQYCKWSYELKNTYELPIMLQRAFKEAMTWPQGPVFLSWPVDLSIDDTPLEAYRTTRVGRRTMGDLDDIRTAAELLVASKKPAIVAGDGCGLSGAWDEVVQLAELLGCPVYSESLSTNMNFPSRDYHWQWELPGDAPSMRQTLGEYDTVLFAGFSSHAPMTVYHGGPPLIPDSVTKIYLHYDEWEIAKNYPGAAAILGDVKTSLGPLNAAVERSRKRNRGDVAKRNEALRRTHEKVFKTWAAYIKQHRHSQPINSAYVASQLAEVQPRNMVYVDEANTGNQPFQRLLEFHDPLSYYSGRGVALGYSMPAALGMALAAPKRRIVNIVGDGGASFYPHVFWTAAKYKLPILFIILNNEEYKTLKQGLEAMKKFWPEATEPPGLNLGPPHLKHTAIAEAYGVPGERVTKSTDVRAALERGLAAKGPYLLEFMVQREVNDTWPTG
jgi:benzoylformate decarboxylase